MLSDEQFLKEVKADLRKDKIINFLKKYKMHILCIVIVLVVIVSSYSIYEYYIKNKAEENSLTFYRAKELIEKHDNTQAIAILDQLIEDGTVGYKLISYLLKVRLLLNENKIQDAIELLKLARDNLQSIPKNYLDILCSIEYMIRMNNNIDDETLLEDLKLSLNPVNIYYFFNLEMYASLLIHKGKYEEALTELNKIATAENVPQTLRERAERIKNLVSGYIGK